MRKINTWVVDKGFQQKYTYFQTCCESVTHYYGAFPTIMMFSAKNVNIYQLPCRMTDYDLFCKTHNSLHYPEVRIVQCNFSEIFQGDQHSATNFIDDNNWE